MLSFVSQGAGGSVNRFAGAPCRIKDAESQLVDNGIYRLTTVPI